MLALVGESGAGKSTLAASIRRSGQAFSGTIHYGSTEISGLADSAQAEFRNREIGFVWQIHYLLPEFTAQENVMMPLLIRGWPHARAASESIARLDEVGLQRGHHIAQGNYRAESSSGWYWPARWLERPFVLLADEPTGNLDFRTGEMIFELLDRLHRSHQLTSVFCHSQFVVRTALRPGTEHG